MMAELTQRFKNSKNSENKKNDTGEDKAQQDIKEYKTSSCAYPLAI